MDKYLLPEDDGLSARESGEWVKEKLFYVQRYIDIFETAMRQKSWRRRIYIDLFAGPGKCVIRGTNEYLLGSPLLALKTQYPFTDYYFGDFEQQNIDCLLERSRSSKVPQNHIHPLTGDANLKVREIVKDIEHSDKPFIQGTGSCLNLAFLDPEGLELEWSTVEALGKMKTMDLIIHYSQSGLTRNLDKYSDTEGDNIIDQFFGDRDWRNVYKNASLKRETIGIHRALIDYYKAKLGRLGYVVINDQQHTVREPLIRNTETHTPLYRLVFASKHPLGNRIWNEVTKKNFYGQGNLL
ncbi:MAG: three-Cys-motif partner protein TcmP [Chloroflexi bacterium]|nr:MAG: three-Cys-motif partner protein TcmP [Chloroflexota bacterium]